MESQPQNPEFRINPENFHPCTYAVSIKYLCAGLYILGQHLQFSRM